MDNFLWWLGWRPKVAWITAGVIALVVAIWSKSIWGGLMGVLPLVPWFMGMMLINKTWYVYFQEATKVVGDSGASKLGIASNEAERHILYYGVGSTFLVKPPQKFHFTPLYIGNKFLGIYEGPMYSLVKRTSFAGSGTRELYYRHINTVEYRAPAFVVRTSSGDTLSYQSLSTEAESALGAVRRRLRDA